MVTSNTKLNSLLNNTRKQLSAGQFDTAIQTLHNVLHDSPGQGDALGLLGMAYAQQGRLPEAIPVLEQAHQAMPQDTAIISNLALALELGGKLEQAELLYRKVVKIQPGNVDALVNLGDALRQLGKLEDAESHLQKALRLNPKSSKAWNNLGILLETRKDYPKAEHAFRKALSISTNAPSILNNLAGVLHKQGNYPEAIKLLKQAIQLKPDYQQAWSNLAAAYTMDYQYTEAEDAITQALKLNKEDASSWSNYAKLKHDIGDFTSAETYFNKALKLSPDNRDTIWHKSFTSLINENYKTGWQEYAAGLSTGDRNPLTLEAPIWNNESLVNKSVFVAAEQGLGDEIMFASCLPDLQETAGKIIYECDQRLLPLFQRSFPDVQFVQRKSSSNKNINTDYQIPSGSLPAFFRKTKNVFPDKSHFLIADIDRIEHWKSRYNTLGDGLKIGISWRGGTRVDPLKRSIPLKDWQPVFEMPHCLFIDIQYGDTQNERKKIQEDQGIHIHRFAECDPISEQNDFAAQLCALDLIISVANATVHLAGALGLSTWSLLPFVPSWRWGAQGVSTPWYPEITLFRQAQMNDWSSVIKNISTQLSEKLKA